jgi:hypothetical protein
MATFETHHELGLNAGKVVEYVQSFEQERNHLSDENDRLWRTIGKLQFQSQSDLTCYEIGAYPKAQLGQRNAGKAREVWTPSGLLSRGFLKSG